MVDLVHIHVLHDDGVGPVPHNARVEHLRKVFTAAERYEMTENQSITARELRG